ncbi:hypothetical protein ACIQ7Q_33670 [Streptomyces sp. NPDC096176]|uniref:hypothetical protein n=1 Tax=Streptomyces sp. NPDC096176 TaxID=3366079 RepID=UPI00380A72B2
MTTLGELFDVAGVRLRAAAGTSFTDAEPVHRRAVQELDRFLGDLHSNLAGPDGTAASPNAADLMLNLKWAREALRTADRLLPGQSEGNLGAGQEQLIGAGQAVAAVRDLIESHRGADGAPVTAYAYTLSTRTAHDYLAQRSAELAWEAGQVAHALTQDVADPGVVAALEDARGFLAKASVLGRAETREADQGVGAMPLALPVEPVQASSSDATSAVTARLGEDCDRLSRVAFETLHDRSEHRMSGSDLQQLSRWTAMARLLSGRVLLRVAEQSHDAPATQALQGAAEALRGSAKAWQEAAAAWHRVVDVSDPRAHPKLPPPSYEIVRLGQVVKLPSVMPHPATIIAHTSVVRVGQLLYGAQWRPEQKPGEARPPQAILDDAREVGGIAASLYRLPATGWQIATAAPVMVRRSQAGLVTDSIDHRPRELDPRMRFYPVRPRQLEELNSAYRKVLTTEQAAAAALLEVAKAAGTPVPRALLDLSAHRLLSERGGWAQQASRPAVRQQREAVRHVEPPVRRPRGRSL